MQKIKKLSIYDLNPRYFKDHSGNGIGDLKGLASKFDYFTFLGVDAVILQDVLAAESKNKIKNFTSVDQNIGNINDLELVLSHAKKHKIKIFLEMKIGSITESHNWFEQAVDNIDEREENIIEFSAQKNANIESKYNNEAKAYFPIDSKTHEIPLNWKSEKVLNGFISVVKFWNQIGITGFVFKDFEYATDKTKTELMNDQTLKELRKFYRAIKEVNDNIVVIGKSKIINIDNVNDFTDGPTKVFDYFQSTQIAEVDINGRLGIDSLGKFKAKELVAMLKKYANSPTNIVSFGTENIGRFISRWGDEGQFNLESTKAFALVNKMLPASSTIYYGDELGAINIGLTHLDDFQDPDLEFRKNNALEAKVTEKEFMEAQVVNGKINAKSLMMWNKSKNGGFSVAEKTIVPPSIEYVDKNVENQFSDIDSSLNFYKKLNKITSIPSYLSIIKNGDFKISTPLLMNGIIKIHFIHGEKEIIVYVNLTNSNKKIIKIPKEGKIILSTYAEKTYDELPKMLLPYEGIIITKYTDEHIKETQLIKIQKIKEKKEAEEKAIKEKESLLKKQAEEEAAKVKEQEKLQKLEEKKMKKEIILQAKEEAKEIEKNLKNNEKEIKQSQQSNQEKIKRIQEEKNDEESQQKEIKNQEEEIKSFAKQINNPPANEAPKNHSELKAEAKEEKTRTMEIKKAEKNKREQERRFQEAVFNEGKDQFTMMKEEVKLEEKTSLREDEIASTTQIDIDDIEDIEDFLKNSK